MTDQFTIKVHPVLNLVQAIRPGLVEGASIVVIGGVTGHAPDQYMVAASAAQAAVRNLTLNLAMGLAPAVRVNTVALGPIEGAPQRELHRADSQQLPYDKWRAEQVRRRGIPLGRFGTPEDVVPIVLLLLSSRSAYITGASIPVSGGLGMRP
jgi:NAD(P)-dependent dehydrogenase (short-subunit alcohol dehydrogenase family)